MSWRKTKHDSSPSRETRCVVTRTGMKRRLNLLVVCSVTALALLWLFARSGPDLRTIALAGITNVPAGPLEPMFSTIFRSNETAQAAIREWAAQGTNVAIFVVTNPHRFPIKLFPVARVLTRQGKPVLEETLLLNAPDFTGILLQRSQVATVHVAAIRQTQPWKLRLTYHREVNSYSRLEEYLPPWLGGLPDQRSAPPFTFKTENRFMDNDWIGE